MEMEKVFQITGYKEIKDGNATIWRRAVPRQSARGLLAQFSNTRKTGGDGVTYPAFAPNVVMPSAKLFGRTAKTISPSTGTLTAGAKAPVELYGVGDRTENSYGYSVDVLLGSQGVVTFDGSADENWQTLLGTMQLTDERFKRTSTQTAYCQNYEYIRTNVTGGVTVNHFSIFTTSDEGSTSKIVINDPTVTSVADWRAKLQANPITVYYQRTTDASFIPPVKHSVFLSKQLNGVGAYEDALDFQKGELVRNVGVKVLDGVDIGVENNKQGNMWIVNFSGKVSSNVEIACSHFPYSTGSSSTAPDHTCISFASYQFGFRADEFSSATEVNNWLAEQYANGTPVTFYIPLATPTTETVTVTPIALTEKGEHTLENTNLVKGDVQVECLSM